jgi:NTP pyrophosphatase (non-canonical NTP hydrolase)
VADYDELAARLRRYRDERDWQQFHMLKDLAIAVSTEAGELLERFLWRTDADAAEQREKLEEEIADVAIYLFFLCDALGSDLLDLVERKHERNLERHPVSTARGRSRPDS